MCSTCGLQDWLKALIEEDKRVHEEMLELRPYKVVRDALNEQKQE